MDYLRRLGYAIRDQNYRIRSGEIDIIAETEGILCIVEVRSRKDARFGHPLETVGCRKQRRLIRATEHYLLTSRWSGPVRFDVIAIVYEPELEITHLKEAFES